MNTLIQMNMISMNIIHIKNNKNCNNFNNEIAIIMKIAIINENNNKNNTI